SLLFERALRLLPGGEDIGGPPSTGFEPGQANLGFGVDEHDQVAECIPTRLIENSGIEDDRGHPASARLSSNGPLEGLPHRRMQDRFEVSERLGPGEDDRPEGPTIDRSANAEITIGGEDLLAEPFEDPISTRALFEEDVADRIGIKKESAEAGESGRGQALPAPDPADHADDGDRAVPPGAGGSATRS